MAKPQSESLDLKRRQQNKPHALRRDIRSAGAQH
jgi:hypothetical protein